MPNSKGQLAYLKRKKNTIRIDLKGSISLRANSQQDAFSTVCADECRLLFKRNSEHSASDDYRLGLQLRRQSTINDRQLLKLLQSTHIKCTLWSPHERIDVTDDAENTAAIILTIPSKASTLAIQHSLILV